MKNKITILVALLVSIVLISSVSATLQTPTNLAPADGTIDTDGNVNFTATVTDPNAAACKLYFNGTNPGQSSYTMTLADTTCYKYLTNIPEQVYKWYVVAINDTDSSDPSSTNTLTVDISKSAGKAALLAELEKEGKLKRVGKKTFTVASGLESSVLGMPVWLIVVLIILIGVIYKLSKK